jgi:hypothetical protein
MRPLVTANEPAGYDNEQAASGECEESNSQIELSEAGECREVYLYDADAGTLLCASCNPTGARPHGPSTLGESPAESTSSSYRRRNLSEAGVLFFDSWDALAGAPGGVENVYGDENGQIAPISNVAGGKPSFLLDASANGENVFFATTEQLVPQDPDGNTLVVYDARVDGGFPVSAPPCTTAEACRNASPPTPATFGPPPSATFFGPGNLAPPPPAVVKKVTKKTVKCKKGDTKNKKGKCVPKKKKKSKRAKKAGHGRRTKS